MAKSFGEALAKGEPVIMTFEGKVPEVILQEGREKEALETMEKMGLIKLMYTRKMTNE